MSMLRNSCSSPLGLIILHSPVSEVYNVHTDVRFCCMPVTHDMVMANK